MSRIFQITFAAVVVVIAIVIWIGFAATKGNHLAPTGVIGKIRVQKVDDDVSFMLVDFNATNDSDRDMIVRTIAATVDTADGAEASGSPVAAADIKSAFHAYPMLGEQYNPVLKERDIIPAHKTIDRMVGLRFDLPAEKLESRRKLIVRVDDVTGAELQLTK